VEIEVVSIVTSIELVKEERLREWAGAILKWFHFAKEWEI
jgi:hypothetical protein